MDPLHTAISELLRNYLDCSYPLSPSQIHQMIPVACSEGEVVLALQHMSNMRLIATSPAPQWYTIAHHEAIFDKRRARRPISLKKKEILQSYTRKLVCFPWIQTILLTGSCALENAKESDDIDLMIITAPGTIFICRLYAFFLAKMLGLARRRLVDTQPDSICINVWLDGDNLTIPVSKVNLYGAREVANAQVVIDRNNTHSTFLSSNDWIRNMLPNWKGAPTLKNDLRLQRDLGNAALRQVNRILGKMQLWYMQSHVTNEVVNQTQLWFHPKLRQ
ncbi:hypothetical protein KBB12_01220 [Candidatus Woesebacteria bacterium]|nr:hypothetical protein [Candidatus Woesebacteria bacterium]